MLCHYELCLFISDDQLQFSTHKMFFFLIYFAVRGKAHLAENLLLHICCVSYMAGGKQQTAPPVIFFFSYAITFFLATFHNSQISRMHHRWLFCQCRFSHLSCRAPQLHHFIWLLLCLIVSSLSPNFFFKLTMLCSFVVWPPLVLCSFKTFFGFPKFVFYFLFPNLNNQWFLH